MKGIFVFSFFCALSSLADSIKVDKNVRLRLAQEGHANVILILKDQADVTLGPTIKSRVARIRFVYDQLRHLAIKSQDSLLRVLKKEKLVFRPFHLINAVSVEHVSVAQMQKIEKISSVSRVTLDFEAAVQEVDSESSFFLDPRAHDVPENIKQISVDKLWDEGVLGEGITIAGQDSGYQWDHPSLKAQYRGYSPFLVNHDYSWHDSIRQKINPSSLLSSCGYDLKAPCDDSGHGTHTMGTMVGYDWASKSNPIGVAPKSKWMGCRNMDRGSGRVSTYLECFEYFLAPYPHGGNPQLDGNATYAPHVVNNSWACPSSEGCSGNEFVRAIDALHAAGIMVVASAGNEGPGCASVENAPGSYSGRLFSVAAYDHRSGEIASFSSRGPSKWNGGIGPNISAPGNGIRSAVPLNLFRGNGYDYKSGTSMAGPHVAGVVALLWSARPTLIGKIQETMDIIQRTAKPRVSSQSCGNYSGSKIPNAVFGFGVIDAYRAVKSN